MQERKNSGFIWAVVLLVIAFLLFSLWRSREVNTDTSTKDTATTATSSSNKSDVSTPVAKPTTATPAKPTTKSASSLPSRTANGEYIINYTSSGFSPAQITLARGSAVHFVNKASGAMRIAPVDKQNQIYLAFSQSKSVGTGGTFDYTFVSSGVYGYYNDNNVYHTGIIVIQ